jgi:hypothetical protein
MKQEEIIVIGLAGLALLLVFKATAKKTGLGTASGVWGGQPNTPIKTPFGNPFGFTYTTQADQNEYNKLIGL